LKWVDPIDLNRNDPPIIFKKFFYYLDELKEYNLTCQILNLK